MSILPEPYSAKVKDSYAFKTLSHRVPVIITKVIDLLCRQRKQIPLSLGIKPELVPKAEEETKQLIEELAKLKYELQTNKPIRPLVSELPDTKIWNDYLEEERKRCPQALYFEVSWMFAECYVYRKMREIFFQSKYFKNYDQFSSVKQESFKLSMDAASKLASHLTKLDGHSKNQIEVFHFFTMTSLWGNKGDLSLSCGESVQNNEMNFKELEPKILVNDMTAFWYYVQKMGQKPRHRIDLVLDNAGYELFSDLCWLEALYAANILPREHGQVYIYVKKMPWFVSDTMTNDINWLIFFIDNLPQKSAELRQVNVQFKENLAKKRWILVEDDFWTLPHEYYHMPSVAPQLYQSLSQSDLILFKGDLNYRKLVGDRKWDLRSSFKRAMCGFQPPTAICSLRTIKADVVVGVRDENILERIKHFPKNWNETGEYAVISFLNNKPEN